MLLAELIPDLFHQDPFAAHNYLLSTSSSDLAQPFPELQILLFQTSDFALLLLQISTQSFVLVFGILQFSLQLFQTYITGHVALH